MIGQFAPGIVVPLQPFFGSMGVAPPPERGRVSSNPPDIHAGNLDNKELVAGTTLCIPVLVPGALFEIGDGHAAQGDGEVDQTGDRDVAARPRAAHRPQRDDADVAARRNGHGLHQHGHRRGPHEGDDHRDPGNGGLPGAQKALEHEAYQPGEHRPGPPPLYLVDKPVYGVHVRMPKSTFK